MSRRAIIAGATGLVGSHLLESILDDPEWSGIHTIGRRLTGRSCPRLTEQVVELDHLTTDSVPAARDLFCCLGTTLRKAGSPEAFRRVDYDAVLRLANAAREAGISQFLLVSSMGASQRSRVLYSRTKGEIERDVAAVGFESLQIIRPSFLRGHREESRPVERMVSGTLHRVSPLMVGPLRKLRPIDAPVVARAMIELAKHSAPGVNIVESDALVEIAK